MQSRYRSPREGLRPGTALSYGGRFLPYGRDLSRSPHNPHPSPRKFDILMEAGRLAAEYLVSRGVIPQEVLCGKYPNGSPPGFERQVRDIPPPSEGRTSALSRLGHRLGDDGRFGSRRRGRLWKRVGPYSRIYDTDSGRESAKSRNWMERGRGDSSIAEEEKEFASSFRWNRSGGVEIKGSALKISADEQPTPSESISEKNYELADDTMSKASSSCTKKDQQLEPASSSTTKVDQQHDADEGSSLVVDETKMSVSEMVDEVRSERSDKLERQPVEENDDNISCAVDGDAEMKDCKDLLKLCCFTKVPTKPRSSVPNRSPKIEQRCVAEGSTPIEVVGREEVKKLHCNENISSEMCSPEDHSLHSDKSIEEALDLHHESFHRSLNSGALESSLIERNDDVIKSIIQETKISNESSPFRVSDEFEHSESTLMKKVKQDVDMDEIDGEGLDSAAFIQKDKEESAVLVGDEMQQQNSGSFRICDLNLSGSPDASEIPVGPSIDHFTSAHRIEMHAGVSPERNMSTRNDTEDACNNSQLLGHAKVVQVINLEDSHEEVNSFDPSKQKNDISYSSLELVLKQATHSDDLHAIQDGYNLEFSEFLGSDISGCPSAHEGLNNLQPGLGLHGAEGYSGVDDHIYVSLEEIPIGFMGVWDQPSQDYEKFF
ncbi:hypothetical protein HPP92_018777 [Vanilla planifolia]|uniref:Uncharacterized protein n=1 Tax=Vanilla planifolia TaxID=51239 RepID=A0A835Q904_VANPL|nr:hypothetical protein HPP92_018777 [Vanilla planifolia]